MSVGIVGSRHFFDMVTFSYLLGDHVSAGERIVSGGARGIDSLAREYARQNGHPYVEFHVVHEKGDTFAERAHSRNQKIVDAADRLIALPCPCSKGTHDTIRRAKEKGIPVVVIDVVNRAECEGVRDGALRSLSG